MTKGIRLIKTRRGDGRSCSTSAPSDVSKGNLHVPCHHLDQTDAMLHQLARFSLPPADILRRPSAPTRPWLASRFWLAFR